MIELVVVIMVGTVLTSIAITSFSGVSGRFATRGARQTFMAMQARARAHAVEFGASVRFNVDPEDGMVWLSRSGDVLEALDFNDEFHVDVNTSTDGDVRLCMNARGFADVGCNSFTSPVTVTFTLGADTTSVRLFTLGQLVIN